MSFSPSPSSQASSRTPSPPPIPFSLENPRPDLPPAVAASALRRLVAHELQVAGFDSATEEALEELEGVVWEFFGSLLERSHDLANLGRRNQPHFADLMQGVQDLGVGGARELRDELERSAGRPVPDLPIKYERPRFEPFVPTLASDDEEVNTDDEYFPLSPEPEIAAPLPPLIPGLDGLPLPPLPPLPRLRKRKPKPLDALQADFLPPLPAKHAYKQTPVFPQSRIPPTLPQSATATQQAPSSLALRHLSTLRSRLNDSQLVASSLRNLIRKTSARATSNASKARVEGEVGPDGLVLVNGVAPVQEEDEADVVDYEGEWYGGRGSHLAVAAGAGTKRSIMIMRVGDEGKVELDGAGWAAAASGNSGRENEVGADGLMGGANGEWSDAGRVGGAGKRRKWRV